MASFLIFVVVALVPLGIYLANALMSMRGQRDLGNRGIAAGIPKPKEAKQPKRKSREGRLRDRRTVYCGRDFAHLALAIVGSQDSCRHCSYLQAVPPTEPPGSDGPDDGEAAVRAAEEIIDQAQH